VITSTAFAGKRYAVLGLARSGQATVAALLASGARVTAWDDHEDARSTLLSSLPQSGGEGAARSADGGASDGRQEAPPSALRAATSPSLRDGEGLAVADFTQGDLSAFDSIVVTPGLPLNRHPITARAREAGVEIIGDIELFARARAELPPHKVVGITGTNGKSTTTALVHHILQTAGVPTTMGGNIGLPILAQDPLPAGGVYVLELSSYQLDLTQSLDCDVAVLLNITPDHLDRYESFEAYAASKARLFEMQGLGLAVDLSGSPAKAGVRSGANAGRFRASGPLPTQGNGEWPSLQGLHNLQNAAAAVEVSAGLGIHASEIDLGLKTYLGLPHRMERVATRDGVTFVNDSKATNAEAAAPALAAFERVRWIVGGQAKGETLGDTAGHLDHVVKAYAIGEAGAMFARLLREARVEVAECGTLERAVTAAAAEAEPGDTVLLSPACASFDQFSDFEARGNAFRALVEAL
jgi:UDP-N-acetylmuramoylalanine--D-glutamate ligase